MTSQSEGREFESRCWQEEFFILQISLPLLAARGSRWKWNQPWHTPSQYPVSDKSSSEKNMAAVCSRISLFMSALTWYVMCSINVHRRICIDQEKGFGQHMTSNKTNESVQRIKPNHNNQQARGSSSRGLVPNLVRYCRWVNLSYFK